MRTFNGTITLEQLEACISQAFRERCRDPLERLAPFILLVAVLVAWPLTGFDLPEPGPSLAMIGVIGLAICAAILAWGWLRMRRVIAAMRRACEERGAPRRAPAPMAVAMDADGIGWSIGGATPELWPWSAVTRIQETRDFLLLHLGARAQVILPKAGFAPEDLAAIRAELQRRLPET